MRRSLQDFGLGRSSLSEGGVGLFVLIGAGFAVALINWARGTAMRTGHPYQVLDVLNFWGRDPTLCVNLIGVKMVTAGQGGSLDASVLHAAASLLCHGFLTVWQDGIITTQHMFLQHLVVHVGTVTYPCVCLPHFDSYALSIWHGHVSLAVCVCLSSG